MLLCYMFPLKCVKIINWNILSSSLCYNVVTANQPDKICLVKDVNHTSCTNISYSRADSNALTATVFLQSNASEQSQRW